MFPDKKAESRRRKPSALEWVRWLELQLPLGYNEVTNLRAKSQHLKDGGKNWGPQDITELIN